MKVNVIVLNYNGEKLIPECLPSIIEAKRASSNEVIVTVIDNQSTDGSLEALKQYSDEIDVQMRQNRVFCSFNDVVGMHGEDVAILLNNDIRVDRGFIDPMVSVFYERKDAFMVAPKCYDFDGEALEGGRSKGFIKFGWFGAIARYPGWEDEVDVFDYTFQSGFGAVRCDRFHELEGYDDLYLPGRLEDSDICFRAWEKGWKCYYQPDSVVYHKGGESFKNKFGVKGISAIDNRNSLLFFWKNISSWEYWLRHVVFLPVRLARWTIRGEMSAVKGVFEAFSRIQQVSERRRIKRNDPGRLSDRAIFGYFR